MLEVHIRTIAAVDLLQAQLLPQWTAVRIFLNDAEGRSTDLWSNETRSFPTLSEIEQEGARLFHDLPNAATYEEAERAAMHWLRTNFLDIKNRSDHRLMYKASRPETLLLAEAPLLPRCSESNLRPYQESS